MRKVIFSIFILFLFGSCNSKQPINTNSYAVKLSDTIPLLLKEEKFDEICKHFDDNMRAQINKEKFAVIWAQLNTQFGKYSGTKRIDKVENVPNIGIKTIQSCQFGNNNINLIIVINKQDKICGLFFTPTIK